MKARAAVAWEPKKPLAIEEIEVEEGSAVTHEGGDEARVLSEGVLDDLGHAVAEPAWVEGA